ncbi:uncharacterized protein LOC119263739 isoform X1 [Pygocentrus nattereri]|uniref:uncharacterized protein LOC119263739 isoform X1 n=1 Tax=Pygocentrus nattereri TaxID=42514 RepID=UPI001890DF2D|nr:uncharacterized protein LOC119263739 isoform X1 [Pygocentrus nattereri]
MTTHILFILSHLSVLIMLSTSLQKEGPGDVSPAEIFLVKSKVTEGQEVKFQCKVTDVRTKRVYVHLCASGTTVKTAELEKTKDGVMFVFDKVTVKDSGLYTCVYSLEKDAACKMNIIGRNSASLEVSKGPGDVSPAEIFVANSKVKEGQQVKFKCKVTDVRAQMVYVHLCASGTTVKIAELEQTKNDVMFVFDKVTVKDSGLYTCVYSLEKDAACKMNIIGRNSASLEVSDILPAKITAAKSSLREGEGLTLTCSITGHQSCSEVYVYLCLNGIGNRNRTVNCNIKSTTTTFLLKNVKQQQSGNYSCVYSTSNYSLSEVRKTGENSIYVEVHDLISEDGGLSNAIILLIVAVAFALGIFMFLPCRHIITLRLYQNPDTSASPDSDLYYCEITPGEHPVDQSHQPCSAGQPCHTVNAVYSTVQKCKGKEGKNAKSFNSSSETPAAYSLAQWCEETTEQPAGYYAEIH